MEKGALLYEGKAKRVYGTSDPDLLWIEYKDSATAFDGKKKAEIAGKGRLNNLISSIVFTKLQERGIASHFVRQLSETEQLVKKVEIIPLEVVVRSLRAGSISKRLGYRRGRSFPPHRGVLLQKRRPRRSLLTEDHIEILSLASEAEVEL